MLRLLAKGLIILLVLAFLGFSTLCGAIKLDDFKEILKDGKAYSRMLSEDFDGMVEDLKEQVEILEQSK